MPVKPWMQQQIRATAALKWHREAVSSDTASSKHMREAQQAIAAACGLDPKCK